MPSKDPRGRLRGVLAAAALAAALVPRASGQALPDLGDASSATLSPLMERRMGESIARDIRLREPAYLDDPEVQDYLRTLGARLVAASEGARHDFEFFALRDPSVNAFALPGGYIGVHAGLVALSDTESELASVLAHEIAHVTQRHIARQISDQEKLSVPVMLGTLAAILAARSNPDLAMGAVVAAQGIAVQRYLNFSRDFEREADRIGLQALSGAGFDPRAMAVFFEKLQRATRVMDDGSMPGYLRTHPMNTERIADAQNRAAALPYRQRADSLEYHLVRAKLRAEQGDPQDAVASFAAAVRERRFASEAGARYGLATALLRARRAPEAAAELERLRALKAESYMVELLAVRIAQSRGDAAGGIALLEAAAAKYPNRRPVAYARAAAFMERGRNAEALAILQEQLRLYPRDDRLHAMQARVYAALGKRLQQHRAQAEVYVLQGSLPAAIDQLELAQRAGDGDFYEQSAVDARLRVLRDEHAAELREQKRAGR